jgi:hypothetical protein
MSYVHNSAFAIIRVSTSVRPLWIVFLIVDRSVFSNDLSHRQRMRTATLLRHRRSIKISGRLSNCNGRESSPAASTHIISRLLSFVPSENRASL